MALVISACAAPEVQNASRSQAQNNMSPAGIPTDQELRALVKTFAEDVGPDGRAPWLKLQPYPRPELIRSLQRLQTRVSEHDLQRYETAFTLANLDEEYQKNVSILTSALTAGPKPDENADTVTVMLGRLIERGDTALLKVLFASVSSADGDLAEALSDVFAVDLRANPKAFLAQLNNESSATRTNVYRHIKEGSLAMDEIKTLKGQLISLSHDKSVSRTANEMLASPLFR